MSYLENFVKNNTQTDIFEEILFNIECSNEKDFLYEMESLYGDCECEEHKDAIIRCVSNDCSEKEYWKFCYSQNNCYPEDGPKCCKCETSLEGELSDMELDNQNDDTSYVCSDCMCQCGGCRQGRGECEY
ncbi:MAG: hypothetical protein H0X03_03545 [Nitrosopumilus sp.]|nr:hypothetical protein [Nitrosopumilus sp.]